MGYVTSHKLTIETGFTEEVGEKLDKLLIDMDLDYIFKKRKKNTYEPSDSWKWYTSEKDMLIISKQLGEEVLLLLEGTGEDFHDKWKQYIKNGKFVTLRPKIVWEVSNEVL